MLTEFLPLSQELESQVSGLTLPNPLGFGTNLAPLMVVSDYNNGEWSQPEIREYAPFELLPCSKIFHYGQQVFEGMKAYRVDGGAPRLFRADRNFDRFNISASRMAMPTIPHDIFFQSLNSLVHYLRDFIPQGRGESLYLRPVMIALDSGLSLAPSNSYRFYFIASPSGSYFSASEVHALIEREDCRAAPGGTGAVKTAGNYGGSIQSAIKARDLGYQQTLWLDARYQKYIEEFSGMNMFAVIDGQLFTPKLSDSILPGITRDSTIELARSLGYKVQEEKIEIDDLIGKIQSGQCTEIFACGTAAIITPLTALGEKDGLRYTLPQEGFPVANKLRNALLDLQLGMSQDDFGWCYEVQGEKQ